MIPFPLILLFFATIVLLARPFTVILHELGHAIPAILMTKKPVSIYIGSYGDPKKSFHFSIGLLEFWIKYNPFSWKRGLCVPSAHELSFKRQIIYILSGPLASVLIAVTSCYIVFTYNLHGSLKLFLSIFLVCSLFDLYVNLLPRKIPAKLVDGRILYSDGYQLKMLLTLKKLSQKLDQAILLSDQRKLEDVGKQFSNIIKSGFNVDIIYRLAIGAFVHAKNYVEAKQLIDEFMVQEKMNSDDFTNAGIVYSQFGIYDEALTFYDKSLELNPDNKYALNNKGFTLNSLKRFDEAIPFFDKAIKIDKDFASSYSNRGLSKIKTGKAEEGLDDINFSLKLDEHNPDPHRNLGIYYLDKREYSQALIQFRKAKELDSSLHLIDELINEADGHVKGTSTIIQKRTR